MTQHFHNANLPPPFLSPTLNQYTCLVMWLTDRVQYLWRAGPVCPRESRGWEWSETRTSQTLGTGCGLAHTDALHSDTQTISYVMTVEFSLESHFYKQLILICYKSSPLGRVFQKLSICSRLSDSIKWIEIEWIEHESLPPPHHFYAFSPIW